jgi:hypothetical protein
MQFCPVGQTFPHAPQFAESMSVYAQICPPSGCGQFVQGLHVPLAQTCPTGHTLPQAPQLAGSSTR